MSRAREVDRNINKVQLADKVVQVREAICLELVKQLHWCHHHPMLQATTILVQNISPLVQCLNKSRITCQLWSGTENDAVNQAIFKEGIYGNDTPFIFYYLVRDGLIITGYLMTKVKNLLTKILKKVKLYNTTSLENSFDKQWVTLAIMIAC